jgi:hypothetical protein
MRERCMKLGLAMLLPAILVMPVMGRCEIKYDSRVKELACDKVGPMIKLKDGSILFVGGADAYVSHDKGKTWSKTPMFAFSNDDGESWSKPAVITSDYPNGWLCYPFIIERRPGEIWISLAGGGNHMVIFEKDFVGPNSSK